jgi:hypothetical protein
VANNPYGGGGGPPQGPWGPPGSAGPPQGPPGWQGPPQYGGPPAPYPQAYPPQPGPPAPAKKNTGVLVAAGCGGVLVLFIGIIVLAAVSSQHDKDRYGSLAPACDGKKVAGAHAYAPGSGPQGVMFFKPAGTGSWIPWTTLVPDDLRSEGVSDTQLVVCAGKETQKPIGQCDFTKAILGVDVPGSEKSFPRTRAYLQVRLVAASTGAVVREGEIEGPEPHACNRYSGKRPGASDFVGDSVGSENVGSWLRAAKKP